MHPEYLYNNDTQDISRRVSELAASNEPALCAHCQEVSRQTDTSSLSLAKDCADRVNDANATLSIIGESLQNLTKSLLQNAGVFRTQNRGRHLLSLAMGAVPVHARTPYAESTERIKVAYARLTSLDAAAGEAQVFYMTAVERHLPAFMERVRVAADFNHGGEALDAGAIRTLCGELLVVLNRAPKVTF